MKVLRDAQLTVCCGQHYCATCLKEWLNSKAQKRKNTCPHCREENFQSFPNKAIIREIKEFKIRCVHKEKGCVWVGEMDALKDHVSKNCGCVKVKCTKLAHRVLLTLGWRSTTSFPSMCGEGMERRHLTHHQKNRCLYRQYTCKHCGYVDTYDAIAGSAKIRNENSRVTGSGNHFKECADLPLKCPNDCGVTSIKRRDMMKHGDACPLEPISCLFSECHERNILRKDMINHKKVCPHRPAKCTYCGHLGTYSSLTGKEWNHQWGPHHYSICDNYPLKCPNSCKDIIKRKNMNTHRETCPLEPLDCPFQDVGCSAGKILRKDIDSHCKDNIQTHLLLVVQSNKDLARKNEELNEEIAHKNEELCRKHEELVHKNEGLVHKIEEFEERIQVLEAHRD